MSEVTAHKLKGACLCVDIQFETEMPGHIDACHCEACRRWVGGPFVAADFRSGITMTKSETLTWFESSDHAMRGFCSRCGSSLFFKLKNDDAFWSIAAGTLALPSGQKISKEIFIDEKPDYYNLNGHHKRLTGAQAMADFSTVCSG